MVTEPFSRGRRRRGGAPPRSPPAGRELGQVLLAVCDLLPPPADVDGEQPLEISGCDVAALEVEFLDGGQDADRCLRPGDLAVLQLYQPEQRAQVVPVARPAEVTVVRVALEPVDMGEDRFLRSGTDDLQPLRRVRTLGIRPDVDASFTCRIPRVRTRRSG